MPLWSMNDGSALSGTHTFTNGSAIVQGNSSADYKAEVKVGDIVVTAGGESRRVLDLHPKRTIPTSGVTTGANSFTFNDHGYALNQEVLYDNGGGAVATGLVHGQTYFIKAVADANTFTVSETAGGDTVNVSGTGNNAQFFEGETKAGMTLDSDFVGSTETNVAATVRRPPIAFTESGPLHLDTTVLGISAGEALGGLDNVESIGVGTVAGGTYNGSAPAVTIAAPTARTIPTANITPADDTFTFTDHNFRTGTHVKYTSNGTNLASNGGTIADDTDLYIIVVDKDTVKFATSQNNAVAGTAIDFTGGSYNAGNNAQTIQGITATATSTISGGSVTGFTITNVGSDYQAVPSVTIAAPTGSGNLNLASGSVLIAADDEIVIPAALYAVLVTGEQMTYSDGGGTAPTGLTDGDTVFAIKSGNTNKMALATSEANALAGTKITLAAGSVAGSSHTFVGVTATATASLGLGVSGQTGQTEAPHTGWVKKTVGTGGKAGRVQYEVLVASGSISGDQTADQADV